MPKSDDDGHTMINARVPDSWIEAIDSKAKQLEAETGATYTRTHVIRMALARFLGLVEQKNNDEQPPATA